MKPIEMPARQLTAGSIWNSFRISGKKHLILTGTRGVGKTTLLKKLVPDSAPGITTWAEPGVGVFLQERGRELRVQIGAFDPAAGGMRPIAAAFQNAGIPALQRCEESNEPYAVIDEIGFLETACPDYCEALVHLLERKSVIAVLRKQELPFLRSLRERENVFLLDLDAPFGAGGCVVMASGLGKRFGGNKLMADFGGKPLIAGCLETTAMLPNRVVVTRSEAVSDYCTGQETPVVLHKLPHRSDTVRLGLAALKDTDYCIFCQGDQPLLSTDTLAAMAMLGAQKEAPILRAGSPEKFGAPILFPKRFYGELAALPQGSGGNFVVKKHPEQVRFVPVRDERELWDVDTPEDLAKLTSPWAEQCSE